MLYNPCAPGTRFGVTADKLPEQLPADIEGFHCHCHCESGADVFQRTLVHIEEKFAQWFPQLKWINFGGGHLMTRKDYDVALLISIMQDFKKRYPWLKVILEPGSAFLPEFCLPLSCHLSCFLYLTTFLQKMDRNKDGVVTIEEFIESCQKVQGPALYISLIWTQGLIQ